MPETHPSPEILEGFMLARLQPADNRQVVQHLLTGCSSCREITGEEWRRLQKGLAARGGRAEPSETPGRSTYGPALQRALAGVRRQATNLARERAEAEGFFEELARHPHARRLTLVRNSRQYQTWGLCELLIDRSYDTRFSEPRRGLELAELAVTVAERLDPDTYGERQVRDIEGRAWSYLGNARRVISELRSAEAAFRQAKNRFDEGTGDPLDGALLSRFRAHLMRARRRFEVARQLQNQALAMYRRCGETTLASQILCDQGVGFLYAGQPRKAIRRLEEAVNLLEHQAEPRLSAGIKHNLAHCFNDIGQYPESLSLLKEVESVYRRLGDRLNLTSLRWLEGKILYGLERIEEAEAVFVEVRKAFIQEENAYDAALVSLDLAAVYAAQGRTAEMRRLAAEMLPIFESRDVHREALAALIIFRQAAEAETASLALVQEIAAYLQKAQHDPHLRFRPSS